MFPSRQHFCLAFDGLCLSFAENAAGCTPPEQHEALALLREKAHIVVGEEAERVQARRRILKEDILRRLSDMSAGVRGATSAEELRRALLIHLPGLEINRGYVASHRGPLTPDSKSVLLFAYDRAEGEFEQSAGTEFNAGELFPTHLTASRRISLAVFPTSVRSTELLGFSVMELGAPDGAVYESLREQLSVSLKASQVLQTLIREATLRERAERARIEGELDIARQIQTAVLPRALEVGSLEVACPQQPRQPSRAQPRRRLGPPEQ